MKIRFVFGDDWDGMYVDGRLVMEGSRIDAFDAVRYIADRGVAVDDATLVSLTEVQRELIELTGVMPQTLDELEALGKPALPAAALDEVAP